MKKTYPVSTFYWAHTQKGVLIVPCEDAHESYCYDQHNNHGHPIDTASIHEMSHIRQLKSPPRVFHLAHDKWRDIYKTLKADGLHFLQNPKFTDIIKQTKPLCPKKDQATFNHLFFGIDPRSLPHIDPKLLRTPEEVVNDVLAY